MMRGRTPGTGDLVHGLACGGGGRRGRPARERPGGGDAGQSRRRLFGLGACGRGAARAAPSGGAGALPAVHVVTADPARDARYFEGVTAAVDEVVPRAEVLRPGLLVLSVRGAARYFGSEQSAAERLVDAVAAAGAECQVGIADQLPTAVFAARAGRIVEPGKDAAFLAALSIRQLATEPSLAEAGREELADLLWRMGIRTIGQFAALSRTDVASRFGADAVVAHRFARGEPDRGPSGREPPPELDAVMDCDPPIDRVDAAAFAGRSLAGELHRSLEVGGCRLHPAGHPRRHRQR